MKGALCGMAWPITMMLAMGTAMSGDSIHQRWMVPLPWTPDTWYPKNSFIDAPTRIKKSYASVLVPFVPMAAIYAVTLFP